MPANPALASPLHKQDAGEFILEISAKEALAAYQKAYREKHRERLLKHDREYHAKNKEERNLKRRLARLANPEEARAKDREAYKKNPERKRMQGHLYRKRHPKRKLAAVRRYNKANPEVRKAIEKRYAAKNPNLRIVKRANRRSRKFGAEGKFTQADISIIWDSQGHKCAILNCSHPISPIPGKSKFHVDHIHPLSLGGSNWPHNLQILCATHNKQKCALTPEAWAARLAEN